MKKLIIVTLAVAALALPGSTYSWVACRGGGGYHAGYGCGGVRTGTAVAYGRNEFAAGVAVRSAYIAPVYAAPLYTSGYVAPAPYGVSSAPSVGSIVYSLPAGAQETTVNGIRYYFLGSTYYQPFFGNNGVYYEVVGVPF